jgi:hypothetical protein
MPLITTIAEVRANGVKVRAVNNESSIADMELAAQLYIVPITGADLYAELLAEYTSPTEDTTIHGLLLKAQRALAPLAYWLDLPNIQTQISESGVVTTVSDKQDAAHRWEFEQVRENLAVKGCFALELMIAFLYENADDLEWVPDETFKSIFKTGVDFSKYFPLSQPYRTFESLRPIVKQVEDQYIRNAIGSDYFDFLRDAAEPTAEESKVIQFIKKAVANLTIKTAIEALSVKFTGTGFTVMLQSNSELVAQGQSNAPDNQLSLMLTSSERAGINYIREMKKYMDATASETILADYFTSEYYTSAEAQAAAVNPNSTRNGIFSM